MEQRKGPGGGGGVETGREAGKAYLGRQDKRIDCPDAS